MARFEYGERIGQTAPLRIGCTAIILDEQGEKVLLTRRADNGDWCLPGGGMEAGESVEEACRREVCEETGLTVEVVRLTGVYSSPHRITVYNDGNRFQFVSFAFLAQIVHGTPGLSDEVTEVGYFTRAELASLKMSEPHRERIADAFAQQAAAFIR
ncbi:MAG: NUDIX domain-containing protein [Caldilineaceae bacterium]|nr:NUDIX domain-containing protein [Caldilineaceae bacterium]